MAIVSSKDKTHKYILKADSSKRDEGFFYKKIDSSLFSKKDGKFTILRKNASRFTKTTD